MPIAIIDLSAEFRQSLRYPRIAGPHELTKNEKRRKILESVRSCPGIHFRELGRVTGIPDGGLQHHLRVLRYHGAITVVRHHNRTLIYLAETRTPAKLLPVEDRTLILQEVSRRPGVRHRELMSVVRLKRTTLDYHMNALKSSNAIFIERIGRERIYHAASLRADVGIAEESNSVARHDARSPIIAVTSIQSRSLNSTRTGSPETLPAPAARTGQTTPKKVAGNLEPEGNGCNPPANPPSE